MEKFYLDKNNKNKLLLIFLIFFVLVTTASLHIFVFEDSNLVVDVKENQEIPMSELSDLGNVVQEGPLDENKVKTASNQDNQDDEDEEEFVFVLNKKVVFNNASSLGDFKIENPASNKYNFYVEVKLKEDEELVYKSPMLEPNHHIKNDYLMKKLNKGTHRSVATVFVVDPENQRVVAEQQTDVQIKIKK